MFQFAIFPFLLILVAGSALYLTPTNTVTTRKDQKARPAITNRIPDQSLPTKSLATDLVRDFNPTKGPKDARVTVIEFLDFQCPACKAIHPVEINVSKKYDSKVRFVFKMFPLKAIHPNAESAAKSALAAAKQGKYFEYADKLFANQSEPGINLTNQEQFAKDLGLNLDQWKQDRESAEIEKYIKTDYSDGVNAQIPNVSNPLQTDSIDSTPTFVFIKNGKIQYKTNGLTTDEFSQKLDELLQN